MEWRVSSLVLLATSPLVPHSALPAQTANAAHHLSIVEPRAQAILEQKSIRLELPLSDPATGNERVVAWLLSPVNVSSDETASTLKPGARSANLALPWPNGCKGKPVDDIGLYRIGYRIESADTTVARGILSVGAIAPNLLAIRLARPSRAVAGMPTSVHVFAGNPVTQRPFKGVRLKATLNLDEDVDKGKTAKRKLVRQAITDVSGEATFTFPAPVKPGDTATLQVEGTLMTSGGSGAFARASLSSDIETDDRTTIHAETDKPLHKPGETVHLRALVLNDAGHAAANAELTLTITTADDKTVEEVSLTTNRFGIVSYDWKTGQQAATGDYEARFEIGADSVYEGMGTVPLRIERYDLPEFVVTASLDSGFYLEGQTPKVKIHAGYLFGKPVAAGTVKIARSGQEEWNPKTHKYERPETPEVPGSLDPNGDAELRLDVKDDFDDLKSKDYERFADIQYRAIVTDASTGRSEPRNFTVRLSHNPVHIYINSVGGDDREGDYLVSTSFADGVPAACKITLDWMNEKGNPVRAAAAATSRYGLAKVHLVYPAVAGMPDSHGSIRLRVTAIDRQGRTSIFDDTLNPDGPGAMWINVAHTLLRPGESIEATVHGPADASVDVDALAETGVLAHLRVHLKHGAAPLTIPAGPAFHGLITLRAYTLNGDVDEFRHGWQSYSSYKPVLYPEDRQLRVKLTGLKTSYPPGAEVDAFLNVNDAAGTLPRGVAGISVFDTAVEQRAATEEEANQRWFGDYWWMGEAQAGGVTRAMLDKTDTSKPIPEDLNLAAEVMLNQEPAVWLEIETSTDSAARTEYANQMERDLKPVGNALAEVRSVRLPGTIDAVREVVRADGLDEGLLIDPWNTPYKIGTSIAWNDEVVEFASAGPDKRFGTGDDMSIHVARRNIFDVPGHGLSEILQQTAAVERPLPGTLEDLKALTKSGGLDLDSAAQGTLSPDGKPFKYSIVVRRRFYSVEVLRDDGTQVWSSPSIDFFSRTEVRMNAAIRSWEEAGKPFPNTEAEALQAFAAAGIDFAALRDPFSKPFQLRSTQLTTYTTVEQVKAGKTIQVTNQSVTHMMQAIQVLRSPDAGELPDQADVVAQFLHPMTEQSGSDIKPKPVEQGTFKANTGAIGGIIADQTGAVVAGATITVTDAGGNDFTAIAAANGTYLVRDLDPGLYGLKVSARGFQTFSIRDVNVSAASRTTVDVELRVGATSETVDVAASAQVMATSSAQVSSLGVMGSARKSIITTPNGRATISEPAFTPRLRHVFEETAYWAPCLETNAAGRAALRFRLPDSLTTWKLHAVASTNDGRIGVLDQTFKTFQPFFVDLDAPQVLTEGDEITLPVNLRNYTAQNLALPVTVKPSDWLHMLTATKVRANVPANGSAPVRFGFRAAKTIDQGPLQITAANTTTGDAIEKQVRVHPDGEPGSATASGLLRGKSTTLELDLPANVIPGSVHADLRLYPNLGTEIVHAIRASLERPYGCGEQTISSTYPSLLFLELLRASNSKSPLESEAQDYLQLGYDRLLSYFDASGGLTYWGGSDPNPDPALTAYAVTFLLETDPFIKVDHERITRAIRWLVDHQQSDGAWKPHFGQASTELALYIAAALSVAASSPADDDAQDLNPRIKTAISNAGEWASKSVAAVHDPYANALRLRLAAWLQDSPIVNRIREELAASAVRDRSGARWTRGGYSPFYGWGRAGDLETTAMVLSALGANAPGAADPSLVNDGLFFLLRSHDRYGIWYSGQATVRVLKALLPFAIEQMKAPADSANFTLTVNGLPLAASDAEALYANPRLLEAPRSVDVTSMLRAGHNELVFSGATEKALASAEVSAAYYTPWTAESLQSSQHTQPGKDYGLDFGYECAASGARAGQPIQCTVDARRFGSRGYGMLLAEVGLPPGADVDRASLAKLLNNWVISRYELQPDRIVFYLWSWRAEGPHFSFAFTPRYAIHAKAAPAMLFDYYNPDLKVVLAPQTFTVQ